MFTLKGVLPGFCAVLVLFVATFVYKSFAAVSGTRTSGMGALLGDLSWIITSPVFWLCAAFTFFVVAFLAGRHSVPGQS